MARERPSEFAKLLNHSIGADRAGSPKHFTARSASFVELPLGDQDRDQRELGEGPATWPVGWPQCDDLFGISLSAVELTEIQETAGSYSLL